MSQEKTDSEIEKEIADKVADRLDEGMTGSGSPGEWQAEETESMQKSASNLKENVQSSVDEAKEHTEDARNAAEDASASARNAEEIADEAVNNASAAISSAATATAATAAAVTKRAGQNAVLATDKSIKGVEKIGDAVNHGIKRGVQGVASVGESVRSGGKAAGRVAAAGVGATVAGAKALDATIDVKNITETGKKITFWTFEKIMGLMFIIILVILFMFSFATIKGAYTSGKLGTAWNTIKTKWNEANPIDYAKAMYDRLFKGATGEYVEGDVEEMKEFVGVQLSDPYLQTKLRYDEDEFEDVELSARLYSYNSRGHTKNIALSCTGKGGKKWQIEPDSVSNVKRVTEEITCYAPAGGAALGQYNVKFIAVAENFVTNSSLIVSFVEKNVLDYKIEAYAREKQIYIKDEADYISAIKGIYPTYENDAISVSDKGPLKLIIATRRQPVVGVAQGDRLKLTIAFENSADGTLKKIHSLKVRIPKGLTIMSEDSCKAYSFEEQENMLKLKDKYRGNANFSAISRYQQTAFPSCTLTVKDDDDLRKLLDFPNLPNPRHFAAEIVYDYEVTKEIGISVGKQQEIDWSSGLPEWMSWSGELSGTCSDFTPDKSNVPSSTYQTRYQRYKDLITKYAQMNVPQGLDDTTYAALITSVAVKESSLGENNRCSVAGKSSLTGCGWPGSSCSSGCNKPEFCANDEGQIKCTSEMLKERFESPTSNYAVCKDYSGQQRWECIFDVYNSGGYPNKRGTTYGRDMLRLWSQWKNYLCGSGTTNEANQQT